MHNLFLKIDNQISISIQMVSKCLEVMKIFFIADEDSERIKYLVPMANVAPRMAPNAVLARTLVTHIILKAAK